MLAPLYSFLVPAEVNGILSKVSCASSMFAVNLAMNFAPPEDLAMHLATNALATNDLANARAKSTVAKNAGTMSCSIQMPCFRGRPRFHIAPYLILASIF